MIRLGTRGSALALAQARIVADALGPDAETVVIRTAGDGTDRPIAELGDGAFVGSIEEALRAGRIDLAVHSLKDLPTTEDDELVLAAITEREDVRDVAIARSRGGLGSLPAGAVVGTSSPRRAAFVAGLRPDLVAREIRGNVDTRLRKVRDGQYDAVVLAAAGLHRLGIAFDEPEALDPREWPPAPGQGALAVQARASDVASRERVAGLDHPPTRQAVTAERSLLHRLGASCALRLGALGTAEDGALRLDAVLVRDGRVLRASARAVDPDAAAALVASELDGVHA